MLKPARPLRSAIVSTASHYLLIVTPVALYIFIEGWSTSRPMHILHSPEWNMATILLAFQGQSTYRTYRDVLPQRLPAAIEALIMLFVLVSVMLASTNIHVTLARPSTAAAVGMWLLFALCSLIFALFLTGAAFVTSPQSEVGHV